MCAGRNIGEVKSVAPSQARATYPPAADSEWTSPVRQSYSTTGRSA